MDNESVRTYLLQTHQYVQNSAVRVLKQTANATFNYLQNIREKNRPNRQCLHFSRTTNALSVLVNLYSGTVIGRNWSKSWIIYRTVREHHQNGDSQNGDSKNKEEGDKPKWRRQEWITLRDVLRPTMYTCKISSTHMGAFRLCLNIS